MNEIEALDCGERLLFHTTTRKSWNGSLYAIVMGPTTLENPQSSLSMDTFNIVFFMIGGAVIIDMQAMKIVSAKSEQIDEKTSE